ncbi:heat shock protein beta-11-like [Engystomops pustulosus]|uniref:heat shock protein beta-11-like n=1 Tax=Engystomops pustulosus TaxID=76066 RepID=UPI003AFA1081
MLSLQQERLSTASPYRPLLRPLWPLSIDIFSSLEHDMIHTLAEIQASMKLMDQFHQQLLQETSESQSIPVLASSNTKAIELKAESPQHSINAKSDANKADTALTISDIKTSEVGSVVSLGVQDFSPEELTVKIVGKKLLVSGAKECKSDDGKGSFSFKCQIFRKELDLPQDVGAEDLSCTVTDGGQLQIKILQTPAQERTVPIQHMAVQAKTKVSSGSKDCRS